MGEPVGVPTGIPLGMDDDPDTYTSDGGMDDADDSGGCGGGASGGSLPSAAQKDRRRELNRMNARLSRMRKKVFLESVKDRCDRLELESSTARRFLREHLRINLDDVLRCQARDDRQAMDQLLGRARATLLAPGAGGHQRRQSVSACNSSRSAGSAASLGSSKAAAAMPRQGRKATPGSSRSVDGRGDSTDPSPLNTERSMSDVHSNTGGNTLRSPGGDTLWEPRAPRTAGRARSTSSKPPSTRQRGAKTAGARASGGGEELDDSTGRDARPGQSSSETAAGAASGHGEDYRHDALAALTALANASDTAYNQGESYTGSLPVSSEADGHARTDDEHGERSGEHRSHHRHRHRSSHHITHHSHDEKYSEHKSTHGGKFARGRSNDHFEADDGLDSALSRSSSRSRGRSRSEDPERFRQFDVDHGSAWKPNNEPRESGRRIVVGKLNLSSLGRLPGSATGSGLHARSDTEKHGPRSIDNRSQSSGTTQSAYGSSAGSLVSGGSGQHDRDSAMSVEYSTADHRTRAQGTRV
jgi:hypothetical protein